MGISNFPNKQYAKPLASDALYIGSFKTARHQQLEHIRLLIAIKGDLTLPSEFLTLYLQGSENQGTWIAKADFSLSQIDYTSYWYGFVRFDFDRVNLNKNLTYHLKLGTTGYTESDTHKIMVVYDYPLRTYGTVDSVPTSNTFKFEIYCYDKPIH